MMFRLGGAATAIETPAVAVDRKGASRSRLTYLSVVRVAAMVTLVGCWPAPGQGPDRSGLQPVRGRSQQRHDR